MACLMVVSIAIFANRGTDFQIQIGGHLTYFFYAGKRFSITQPQERGIVTHAWM